MLCTIALYIQAYSIKYKIRKYQILRRVNDEQAIITMH